MKWGFEKKFLFGKFNITIIKGVGSQKVLVISSIKKELFPKLYRFQKKKKGFLQKYKKRGCCFGLRKKKKNTKISRISYVHENLGYYKFAALEEMRKNIFINLSKFF